MAELANPNLTVPKITASLDDELSIDSNLVSTPVMRNPSSNGQFESLVTPQLPPPPLITPTQPMNIDPRRLEGRPLNDVRRNLATDQKTPAEYTLHILFTQFVRYAERKLNVCLNNYSLETEPPIIEILSEGADPEFDMIVESLGHIARRKPKPVIDSVMFWRKSKAEVSMLAAAAVEKNLKLLRSEQKKFTSSQQNSTPTLNRMDSKSQLSHKTSQRSLYRQPSLSFIRGHRNNSSKTTLVSQKSSSSQEIAISNSTLRSLEAKLEESKITAIQAERKSLISIYILCRVLIDVVRQTPIEVLGDDLADKLEEIIYTQLKTTDPLLISDSVIRSSNWNLFAQLLGHMSEKRFLNVSDRFIADLERVPPNVINGRDNFIVKNDQKYSVTDIFNETGDNEFIEESLSLLIHGMRYLNLKHYPLDDFEESADFLQSIGKFFSMSQTESLITAYSEVLNQLLLPLAGVITAEVNHPQWGELIDLLYRKLYRILQQDSNIYWDSALNLLTTVLAVSPTEIFLENWRKIIEANSSVLKPKVPLGDRIIFITCFTRLLWVYLYRCSESLNSTHRTLDVLFKAFFLSPSIRKLQWLTLDAPLMDVLVYLIRICGYSSLTYTLESVLLPLIKQGFNGQTLESLLQPQLVLAVKAYVWTLKDFAIKKRPLFPSDEVFTENQQDLYNSMESLIGLNIFNNREPVFQKETSNAAMSEEISNILQKVLLMIDLSVGAPSWQLKEESQSSNGSSYSNGHLSGSLSFSSKTPFASFLHGKDHNLVQTKSQNTELFATLIEAAPYISESMSTKKLIELLVRNATHQSLTVRNAAVNSLKALIVKKNPKLIITVFARFAFQLDDNPKQNFSVEFLTSPVYIKLLKLYVDLLLCWLNSLRFRLEAFQQLQEDSLVPISGHPLLAIATHQSSNGNGISRVDSNKIGDELELKNIVTIIEEVEGNGLFFLCSQDFNIRSLGLQILKIISQFDDVIYDISTMQNGAPTSDISKDMKLKKHARTPSKFVAEFGTRLIHVLEGVDFFDLISPLESEISYPERSRLKELKLRRKKSVLTYLARSDYGIDSTLWFKIFPRVLKIIFEKCAIPIALCRSIVCIRLVQLFDTIFEYANMATVNSPHHTHHQSSSSTSSFFSSFSSNEDDKTSLLNRPISQNRAPPELLVEQWRIYLIFACSTLTSTNEQKLHVPSPSISSTSSGGAFARSHMRKRSQQVFTVQHQKITSAKAIFKMVVPLLGTEQSFVRDAVVVSLSSMNINIFKSFIESVMPIMDSWMDENQRKNKWDDRVRIEIARVLNNVTFGFLQNPALYNDDWILANLVTIIKYLKSFLSTPAVQINFEFQRLRRYFSGILENVFNGILKTDDPEKWLPFEARVSCFTFLEEWSGYGRSKFVAQDRYLIINKRISSARDPISLSATIELERTALEYAAISCMATICSRPIEKVIEESQASVVMSFDKQGLLDWFHTLFSSSDDKIHVLARKALLNILTVNPRVKEIYTDIINQCFLTYQEPKTIESYFLTLSEALLKLEILPVEGYQILTFCFFAVGNDNHEIRYTAFELLKHTERIIYNTSSVELLAERICSKSKPIYKSVLFHVATIFCKDLQIISELARVFHIVGSDSRKEILSALLPFLNSVELKPTEDVTTDKITDMVLYNLFEITIKYSDVMQNEVEGLWVSLANGNNGNNVNLIISFIIKNCLQHRNPFFVQYARQVVVYIFNTPTGSLLVNEFLSNLEPRHMVPPVQPDLLDSPNASDMPYVADIWETLNYTGKEAVFSLGQISIIFLADLLISPPEILQAKLPLLLHISIVLLDHYSPLVQNVAAELLMHMVHFLSGGEGKSAEIILLLRKRELKTLWVYDDLNSTKNGARTPATMDMLIRDILEVLSPKFPNLQEEWSRVSLFWATTCAVRHIACRSFQVFRSLLSFLDQAMLRDMLHRLSNTISDETPEIQGFSMQILMTLNAVTAELDSLQLIDFPQLFWSAVACLSSVHEQEYIEVLSTLSKFVSKIDLDSELTVSCLTSTFPPKWEGKFDGIQQIVMIGLRSSNSWDHSLKLLDRLNQLHDSQIIGSGNSRLLLALLSNLPRYLHAFETNDYSDDVIESAETICKMVDRLQVNDSETNDRSALKRILESFIKKRFRTKLDFLNETVNKIVKYFFPEFEAQTLVFLLGILSNSLKWVKVETMELLEKVFPWVDLQREEFIGVGADLISPLLRLLLTDYAEQALKVLDEAVSISGSQLDKDVLRMSLGNKTIRKEYEKTATLFGIPDESGWAVPMPAVTAATTRNNVHSVFSTCVTAANNPDLELQITSTNVEFHTEEYSYVQQNADMGDNLSVVESHQQVNVQQQDPSLSHIYAALVNLDSFFADDATGDAAITGHSAGFHQYNSSIDTKESTSEPIIPFESAPQVYDKKVSAILNRSLARTPSNTSFKTSLADSFGTSPSVLTDQYSVRDHNSHNLSQRTSYMSFRSSRNSTRRPVTEISNSSLATSSVTDLTKPQERSPHGTPPMLSPSLRNLDSPSQFSDQYQPQPQQESSFRFEGILRSSNKNRRRSGRAYNHNSHSNSPMNTVGHGTFNNGNTSGELNGNGSLTHNNNSSNTGLHDLSSDHLTNSTKTSSPAQTVNTNGTSRVKDRSSVFSRGNKKNSPRHTEQRDSTDKDQLNFSKN